MASRGAGIALGCSTHALELLVGDEDEDARRLALAAFFAEHEGCDVFVDVSRTEVPLPRRSP